MTLPGAVRTGAGHHFCPACPVSHSNTAQYQYSTVLYCTGVHQYSTLLYCTGVQLYDPSDDWDCAGPPRDLVPRARFIK